MACPQIVLYNRYTNPLMMFIQTQKILRKIIILTAVFFTVLFLSISWFVFGFHTERNFEPRLAFWMEHDWSNGTTKDFSSLKEKVDDLNITDLYFHVGPLNADGSVANDLNIFKEGLDVLGPTNYAWVGSIRNKIDLDNENVRARIILSSKWLLKNGFDGIHLDIEPVLPSDTGFISLLQEMRAKLPDAKISVATDEWQPDLISKYYGSLSYWTSNQIKEVAKYANQIVVMTYDTGFKDPNLYQWWVEQQTIATSNLVPDNVELFIGIPSYNVGESFDPNAENVSTGLAGFLRGYNNIRTSIDRVKGIAVYSYWETDESEFKSLESKLIDIY